MIDIPDYTKINFAIDKDSAKRMIDWGVSIYNERSETRKTNTKLYDAYNGIIDKKKYEYLTRKRGDESSTPYISYRIGRNKIKQLIGEFLQIGIKAVVFTINPEARKQKYEKYLFTKSTADFKPQLEKVRSLGVEALQGMKIPSPEEVNITDTAFKRKNEIVMQIIIDYKILKDSMIMTFLENWKSLILTSEVGGKLDRLENGEDYFRAIDPNDLIFLESPGEFIVQRSPIVGERRLLYKHEILQEFDLSKDDKEKLDSMGYDTESSIKKSGQYLYPVYSFQFYGKKTIRTKTGKNASGIPYRKFIQEHEYEKKKTDIQNDIKKGKYVIDNEKDLFTIYEGSLIGTDIYAGIKEKENNIIQKDESGNENLKFDYRIGLFGTVNGMRVPMQAIVYEMEKIYNAVRRQINVEISKLRGDFAVFDEAFMKNKTVTRLSYELAEHGVTTINSADPGMTSDDRESIVDRVVKSFKLGDSQTIQTLLAIAVDIEQTLDRQTGMNNDRSGFGQASSTATTNTNNVNASVSMTYDMFQFMQYYINDVISMLAEKIKINWTWINGEGDGMILSDEQYGYLKATRDLTNDSYGAFVTDGRLEFDISRKLENYFLQDINASKIRTIDVAKFYTNKSFAQGMKVLEDAYNDLMKASQSSQQQKLESDTQNLQSKIKSEMEWREDEQQSRKDEIVLKGKIEEQKIITKGNIDKGISTDQRLRDHMKERDLEELKQNNNVMSQ